MKRIIMILLSSFLLIACGTTSENNDALIEELNAKISALEGETKTLSAANNELNEKYNALEKEYKEYKESMKLYEQLSAAEAEAALAKAEEEKRQLEEAEAARKAEEEAEEAARKAEEEAAKAAEEAAGYETGITYDQLARTPDDYVGKKIKFNGKVVQVMDGGDTIQIRLAVGGNYDTILYCEYDADIVSSRVLEDDWITVYGISYGLISYESTLGGQITIPAAVIEKIDQ